MSAIQTEKNTFLEASHSQALKGQVTAPGDKSISHRTFICGGLAQGTSYISGLLESADVLATGTIMEQLGAKIEHIPTSGTLPGTWKVTGVGKTGLHNPEKALDFGNSGTGARLIMGLIATSPLSAALAGDASLSSRPMGRVLDPLGQMGASVTGDEAHKGCLPFTFSGATTPRALHYRLPVASAQVKSAILLAGLNAPGKTSVIEPSATRDHTERMLVRFGVPVRIGKTETGEREISLTGPAHLKACDIQVPGDPSSAAFPAVSALIVPDSQILIENVLTNPLRFGLYKTLLEMGAAIDLTNVRSAAGEDIADLKITASALKGVTVPPERAPTMIDEYPILAIAAACATGRTVMQGLKELRVKESDRLDAMATGLRACGVEVETGEDWLAVTGSASIQGGATISTHMDHRIAMSFLTLGLVAQAPIRVDGAPMIATSFPNYTAQMTDLGAPITEASL